MSTLNFVPVISAGEIILVTGVNGFIGAHVADRALRAGYRVRGTVRDPGKAVKLEELFNQKYGKGNFEVFPLENMEDPSAWEKAIQGVSGIAHIAVDKNISDDLQAYIPKVLASVRTLLVSASKEAKVKRVVLTSSTLGAVQSKPNVEFTFGADSYNEEAIKQAQEPPFSSDKMMAVYAASKALSEKELFQWVEKERPTFTVNTVLPSVTFGRSLTGEWQSTGEWAKMVYEGNYSWLQYVPTQHFIDVVDIARLHLGALVLPGVEGERLFGMAEPFNWQIVLEHIKKMYPDRVFSEAPGNGELDLSHGPTERAAYVLEAMGFDHFKSLERSLAENLEGLLMDGAAEQEVDSAFERKKGRGPATLYTVGQRPELAHRQ